jgi:hypothetical protein
LRFALKISGNAVDAITLERACEIAQAELDLMRVGRAKLAAMSARGRSQPLIIPLRVCL